MVGNPLGTIALFPTLPDDSILGVQGSNFLAEYSPATQIVAYSVLFRELSRPLAILLSVDYPVIFG